MFYYPVSFNAEETILCSQNEQRSLQTPFILLSFFPYGACGFMFTESIRNRSPRQIIPFLFLFFLVVVQKLGRHLGEI